MRSAFSHTSQASRAITPAQRSCTSRSSPRVARGPRERPVEHVAGDHVDEGEAHHGQQDSGGGDAEEALDAPPPHGAGGHWPAATFFSSARNSARIFAASTPLADA